MCYANICISGPHAFIDRKVFKFAVTFLYGLKSAKPRFSAVTRTKCYFLQERAAGSGTCQAVHQGEGGQDAKTSP